MSPPAPAPPGAVDLDLDGPTEPCMLVAKRVALFGSSRDDLEPSMLQEAERLGRRLARAGFTLVSGGYGGLMRAAAQGAHAEGGTVVGVTAEYNPDEHPNPYVTHEVRHADLLRRIRYLIESVDAFVVLPGGVGTLSELTAAWTMIKTQGWSHQAPPLLLWHDPWAAIAEALEHSPGFWRPDLNLVTWVHSAQDALTVLTRQVRVGQALARYETETPSRRARIERYLHSHFSTVRRRFADLEPVIWRPFPMSLGRPRLIELAARMLEAHPREVLALDGLDMREVIHGTSDVWTSELEGPLHGRANVRAWERTWMASGRGAGIQEYLSRRAEGEVPDPDEPGEGDHLLRVFDLDAGWLVVFQVCGDQVAVSAACPAKARQLVERVELAQ